jgi:hypothetical protein
VKADVVIVYTSEDKGKAGQPIRNKQKREQFSGIQDIYGIR